MKYDGIEPSTRSSTDVADCDPLRKKCGADDDPRPSRKVDCATTCPWASVPPREAATRAPSETAALATVSACIQKPNCTTPAVRTTRIGKTMATSTIA